MEVKHLNHPSRVNVDIPGYKLFVSGFHFEHGMGRVDLVAHREHSNVPKGADLKDTLDRLSNAHVTTYTTVECRERVFVAEKYDGNRIVMRKDEAPPFIEDVRSFHTHEGLARVKLTNIPFEVVYEEQPEEHAAVDLVCAFLEAWIGGEATWG